LGIGDLKPIATSDCDTDSDADSENAFPAALSGSQAKATGFADGYLLEEVWVTSGLYPKRFPIGKKPKQRFYGYG
jgi:hypothetical protein